MFHKSIVASLLLTVPLLGCGDDPPPPPPIQPGAAIPAQPGAAAPGVAQPVAQPAAQAGASNFGTISVAPGFTPDPSTATGTSGGAIQASNLNPSCRGWVSQTPDHILMANGQFPFLRVLVNGGNSDTTLVIQRPDGSYICDDDGGDRFNPMVQIQPWPAGQYKIWVGSYQQGQQLPYTIGVTELQGNTTNSVAAPAGAAAAAPGVAGGAGAGALDVSGQNSNFGAVALNPGFMPDPHVVNGTSGGAINAGTVNPSCRGWVSATPDHIFNATGGFNNLRVLVSAGQEDTTLVIRRPDGTFMCDDDGGEQFNPMVTGAFPAGQYLVWVGSYRQGTNAAYRLAFTELGSTTASTF